MLRFVLADTEQLHRKISEMSERIRQLEDALHVATYRESGGRHPLLSDDLLAIKHGIDSLGPSPNPSPADEPNFAAQEDTVENLGESLGTLVITEGGGTRCAVWFRGQGGRCGSEMVRVSPMSGEDGLDTARLTAAVIEVFPSCCVRQLWEY